MVLSAHDQKLKSVFKKLPPLYPAGFDLTTHQLRTPETMSLNQARTMYIYQFVCLIAWAMGICMHTYVLLLVLYE
jgi:hypothetical protein